MSILKIKKLFSAKVEKRVMVAELADGSLYELNPAVWNGRLPSLGAEVDTRQHLPHQIEIDRVRFPKTYKRLAAIYAEYSDSDCDKIFTAYSLRTIELAEEGNKRAILALMADAGAQLGTLLDQMGG